MLHDCGIFIYIYIYIYIYIFFFFFYEEIEKAVLHDCGIFIYAAPTSDVCQSDSLIQNVGINSHTK